MSWPQPERGVDRHAGVDGERGGGCGSGRHPRQGEPESHRLRYRLAFAVTATVMLAIVSPCRSPSPVSSTICSARRPERSSRSPRPRTLRRLPTHSRVHLAFVAINEVELMAKLRISGPLRLPQRLRHEPPHRSRLGDAGRRRRRGPAAVGEVHTASGRRGLLANLRAAHSRLSDSLPLRSLSDGHRRRAAARPCGRHGGDAHSGAGRRPAVPHRPGAAAAPEDVASHSRSTRESLRSEGDPLPYLNAFTVSFERPRVCPRARRAARRADRGGAAYSVFLRPLQELFVNAGALRARRLGDPRDPRPGTLSPISPPSTWRCRW